MPTLSPATAASTASIANSYTTPVPLTDLTSHSTTVVKDSTTAPPTSTATMVPSVSTESMPPVVESTSSWSEATTQSTITSSTSDSPTSKVVMSTARPRSIKASTMREDVGLMIVSVFLPLVLVTVTLFIAAIYNFVSMNSSTAPRQPRIQENMPWSHYVYGSPSSSSQLY
uniref:Uncharacterized protein n=2 Tax=Macrostomum lignano TaxID=282301 RepID=A0A1I8JFU0_9PLAT